MRVRTNTLLLLVYGVIGLIVTVMVVWFGMQYQSHERLLAELDAMERHENRQRRSSDRRPKPSLRPALVRLQRSLEERTDLVRDQQSKLNQQISGRQQLEEKHQQLTVAYEELRREHELLINELQFYLNALSLAANELSADSTSADALSDKGLLSDSSVSASEQIDALVDALEPEDLELLQLRQELEDTKSTSQRDTLLSGYASHAMIEMGAQAVPVLTAVLEDETPEARSWAVWVLGQIGSEAAVAIPAIEMLLDDDNEEVAAAATEAIRKIDR